MLGRFLEFSVQTSNIIDSLGFYRLLGFHELEIGDVLLLNKQIGEPVDILISDKKIMKGLPVQYKGRYGVQTQELNA